MFGAGAAMVVVVAMGCWGGDRFLLDSIGCVRGVENGVANFASEHGRRGGYVYSFGFSDCSSILI